MKIFFNKIIGVFKISLIILSLFFNNLIYSQDFGADVVSSYVWRGTQFGSGAHVQPYMSLGSGNFEAGVWGSFPTSADGGGDELDLYLGYDFGPFALTITNYTFPVGGGMYSDGDGLFEGDYTEVSASTSIMGVDLSAGYFTDVEALYIEIGFSAGLVDIAVGYGNDKADPWYANGGSGIVNMSFSASKEIKFSDGFSLPVFGSFIYNPNAEAAFLVFGFSL